METKYYYSYNTEENAFLGKFPAIKNPRRQTEYLLPAMATFKAPPETKEKEVAIWNGADWVIELDFRGEQQVNLETYEVTTVEYVGKIKDGYQSVTSEVAEDIQTNPDKYKVVNGILTDISNTNEYKEFLHQQEVQIRKSEIERQLLELDTKRVRAMCEPSIKDESTGETWLDYYNAQVAQLREELNSL